MLRSNEAKALQDVRLTHAGSSYVEFVLSVHWDAPSALPVDRLRGCIGLGSLTRPTIPFCRTGHDL